MVRTTVHWRRGQSPRRCRLLPNRASTLHHCSVTYPKMDSEHGLVCSFNPTFPTRGSRKAGWISQNHFALDQGPVILIIENYRSGLIWRLMRGGAYVAMGLQRAGFSGGWLSRT